MSECLKLLAEDNAFFLIEFLDGVMTSLDGGHSTPEGVTQAFKLWQGLGFIKPGRTYKMVQVLEVDMTLPANINHEALGVCQKMMAHARRRS